MNEPNNKCMTEEFDKRPLQLENEIHQSRLIRLTNTQESYTTLLLFYLF